EMHVRAARGPIAGRPEIDLVGLEHGIDIIRLAHPSTPGAGHGAHGGDQSARAEIRRLEVALTYKKKALLGRRSGLRAPRVVERIADRFDLGRLREVARADDDAAPGNAPSPGSLDVGYRLRRRQLAVGAFE